MRYDPVGIAMEPWRNSVLEGTILE